MSKAVDSMAEHAIILSAKNNEATGGLRTETAT
jgi:hypothetical protein